MEGFAKKAQEGKGYIADSHSDPEVESDCTVVRCPGRIFINMAVDVTSYAC